MTAIMSRVNGKFLFTLNPFTAASKKKKKKKKKRAQTSEKPAITEVV